MNRKTISLLPVACLLVAALLSSSLAQDQGVATTPARTPQSLVDAAAKKTLEKFADKKLEDKQLSITLIDLRNPDHPTQASFRGNERIYPASVVKLFYLVAAHRWLEDKKIEDTPELRRAMKDMIVDSSNEATQYVVDVLTHTTAGYELPPKEMAEWQDRRNAVNGDCDKQGCHCRSEFANDGTSQARLFRHEQRCRRSGAWIHGNRTSGDGRCSPLVKSRLDQHHQT